MHDDDVTGPTTSPEDTSATRTIVDGRGVGSVHLPVSESGTKIGRYEVIEVIARGGMGVVYEAYDPELDRRIALKLLRSTAVIDSKRIEQRERMLREAQALAQLSHPNVITVFDAGVVEGVVFIAMELVEGATLTRWLKSKSRSHSEIIRVMASAGEGLAAAHSAGLVHRDVKPSNIIVGDDGRVRVIDFGLARASDSEVVIADAYDPDIEGPISGSSGRWLDTTLTRAGMVMGTPRYMAPEQHLGGSVDALCDQYSYAATLHKVLYGVCPIERDDYRAIKNAATAGELDAPPTGVRIRGHLARVIRRGLEREPASRYPSMRDLLTDLQRDPYRRLRIGLAVGAALAAAVAITVLVARGRASGQARCTPASESIAGVWDDDARDRARAGMAASKHRFHADTFRIVAKGLDDYAQRVSTMQHESCTATRRRKTQSDELFDLRAACLAQRVARLDALVSVLSSSPTSDTVGRATRAVAELPGVDECADAKALRATVPLPGDKGSRKAVEELSRLVARARTDLTVGRFREGMALLGPRVGEVDALRYPPLTARFSLAIGDLYYELGKLDLAVSSYEKALLEAARAKQPKLLAYMWIEYLDLIGTNLDQHDRGLTLTRAARVAVAQADDDPLLLAKLESSTGALWAAKGKYKKAVAHYRDALKIQSFAPANTYLHTMNRMATSLKALGKFDQSATMMKSIIAKLREMHGDHHHKVATAYYNLSLVYTAAGRYDQAWPQVEKARVMLDKVLQPDDPRRAVVLTAAANALKEQGKLTKAHDYLKRALAIRRRSKAPASPEIAYTLQQLGDILGAQDKYAEAHAHLQEALAVRRKFLPPNHNHIGESLAAIAGLYWNENKLEQATSYYEQSLAIYEVAFGKKHPFYAVMLLNLGELAMEQKKFGPAVRRLEQAVATLSHTKGSPARLADAQFILAKALLASGRNRRAVRLAQQARSGFSKSGKSYQKDTTKVTKWLRQHQ